MNSNIKYCIEFLEHENTIMYDERISYMLAKLEAKLKTPSLLSESQIDEVVDLDRYDILERP